MAFGSFKTLLTNQTCRRKKTVGTKAHRRTRTEGVVSNKPSMSDVNECSYRSLGCDTTAYQRTILDREKRGFCFDLNVRHYVCVSIYTHLHRLS